MARRKDTSLDIAKAELEAKFGIRFDDCDARRLLVFIANELDLEKAITVVKDDIAKSVIKRFHITRIEQLAADAKVRPMISERDRQLVINYLKGTSK